MRRLEHDFRPRLGVYCPGNGTGGPWRYSHSILATIDLAEFDIVLFSDYQQEYAPRPAVKTVRICETSPHADGRSHSAVPTREAKPGRAVLRRLIPSAIRLWCGFGRQASRLAQLFRPYQLDMLHTNNTGCEESPVAARMAGVGQVIGTFHVGSSVDLHGDRSGPRYRILEMVSNRCLDRAIAVSGATKRDWVRRTHLPADRVVTIYNGIDTNRFRRAQATESARRLLGLPLQGLIIGGLGRLDEAKGFRYLIDAVGLLAAEFPTLTLVIGGDGPLRPQLEEEITRLGLNGRVLLPGFRRDVQPLLDAMDVFVLPSLSETLGYALLEAMATELPAVGTVVGGVPEVIVPGETGFVVPPRSPVALANALRPLLQSTELRHRFGQAGRQRVVQHFQERDMVRKTIQLYRDMLRR